jgi:hypothetical protein
MYHIVENVGMWIIICLGLILGLMSGNIVLILLTGGTIIWHGTKWLISAAKARFFNDK